MWTSRARRSLAARSIPRWLAVGALVSLTACAGRVGRAERWVDAAEDGDPAVLAGAIERADQAAARRPDDPASHAVRGRAHALRARSETGEAQILALEAAADSFERALAAGAQGAVHASMSQEVPEAEILAMNGLVNEVEARALPEAARRLDTSLRLRRVAAALIGPSPDLEAKLRRLGVQVAASTDRPEAAREHYEAFVAATDRQEPLLACLVARSLAEAGDPAAAVAFVAPLSDRLPDDEALLRTEVEIRVSSGDTAGAVARIERARERLLESVSGAYLAAGLYDAVGEPERARAAWQRVMQLDPRHVDARVALGRSFTLEAVDRRQELLERSEELDTPRPSREILEVVRGARQAWADAEEHLLAAVQLDPRSRPAAEALVALYEARVAGIDPETASRADREALAVDEEKLRAAREALSALEPT
jgi:tetratricopeptide (TPR) repeat protein